MPITYTNTYERHEPAALRIPPQPPTRCVYTTTSGEHPCRSPPAILLTLFRLDGTLYARGFYCVPHAHAQCVEWMTENRELRDTGLGQHMWQVVIEPANEYTESVAAMRRQQHQEQEGEGT